MMQPKEEQVMRRKFAVIWPHIADSMAGDSLRQLALKLFEAGFLAGELYYNEHVAKMLDDAEEE